MTYLEKLQELRRRVNYEEAAFGSGLDYGGVTLRPDEVTDFIRDQTELYRNSWINPIIDQLIAREQRIRDRRNKRKA